MALTDKGRKAAVDGLATSALYISLHTTDPSTTGAGEVSGGSPTYARKAVSWSAATNGARALSGPVTLNIPAGSSISHFGLWDSPSSGNFLGAETLRDGSNNPVVETFGGQGTYTLTAASLAINNA